MAKALWLYPGSTLAEPGALTVAGQWRNFTAFPSILTIAVVAFRALRGRIACHELSFDDINFYKRDAG
jgi:hypothetical protein